MPRSKMARCTGLPRIDQAGAEGAERIPVTWHPSCTRNQAERERHVLPYVASLVRHPECKIMDVAVDRIDLKLQIKQCLSGTKGMVGKYWL